MIIRGIVMLKRVRAACQVLVEGAVKRATCSGALKQLPPPINCHDVGYISRCCSRCAHISRAYILYWAMEKVPRVLAARHIDYARHQTNGGTGGKGYQSPIAYVEVRE
jgi:hypothetical protein